MSFNDATYDELEELLWLVDYIPSKELGYLYCWVNVTFEEIQGGVDPLSATDAIQVLRESIKVLPPHSGIV